MPQAWRRYEVAVTVTDERDEVKVRSLFEQFRGLLQANGISIERSVVGAPVSGHRNSVQHGRASGDRNEFADTRDTDQEFIDRQVQTVLDRVRIDEPGPVRVPIQHMGDRFDEAVAAKLRERMKISGKSPRVTIVGAGWLLIEGA